jgi:hypothetical protein
VLDGIDLINMSIDILQMDPSNHKTIIEIQAERAQAAAAAKAEEASDGPGPAVITPMGATASISTLRQKLQDKLDSFKRRKQGINAVVPSSSASGPSRPSGDAENEDESDAEMDVQSRDEMMEETRRRRGEVRDKRRAKRRAEKLATKEEKEAKGKKKAKVATKTGEEEAGKGKGKAKEDFKAKPGKVSDAELGVCVHWS